MIDDFETVWKNRSKEKKKKNKEELMESKLYHYYNELKYCAEC